MWDTALRLELVCNYAKEVKKEGENVIGDAKWLVELDNVLQYTMKKIRSLWPPKIAIPLITLHAAISLDSGACALQKMLSDTDFP